MITDLNDLLLFVHKPARKDASVNRLWLIEATLDDQELELLHLAANYGYISLDRQISSGSDYISVELTTSGRAKIEPPLLCPQVPPARRFAKLSRWLSDSLALRHKQDVRH